MNERREINRSGHQFSVLSKVTIQAQQEEKIVEVRRQPMNVQKWSYYHLRERISQIEGGVLMP